MRPRAGSWVDWWRRRRRWSALVGGQPPSRWFSGLRACVESCCCDERRRWGCLDLSVPRPAGLQGKTLQENPSHESRTSWRRLTGKLIRGRSSDRNPIRYRAVFRRRPAQTFCDTIAGRSASNTRAGVISMICPGCIREESRCELLAGQRRHLEKRRGPSSPSSRRPASIQCANAACPDFT